MRLDHLARITVIVRDLEFAIAEHSAGFTQAHIKRAHVPDARATGLGVAAIAGARVAFIALANATAHLELIEQPAAVAENQHLGWSSFELKQNSLWACVNCADSVLSAAFYLGLGGWKVQQIDANTREIRMNASTLRFESSQASAPAMNLGSLSCGILSVQLARVGSRGQAGPLRVLRGPDAELIELV